MSEKENNYYVYLHRKADTNEVFYVGKGCGKRAEAKTGRNIFWKNIYAKHGRIVGYVEKGMSEDAAYDLEVELIKFYRETGHALANLEDGGKGGCRNLRIGKNINLNR